MHLKQDEEYLYLARRSHFNDVYLLMNKKIITETCSLTPHEVVLFHKYFKCIAFVQNTAQPSQALLSAHACIITLLALWPCFDLYWCQPRTFTPQRHYRLIRCQQTLSIIMHHWKTLDPSLGSWESSGEGGAKENCIDLRDNTSLTNMLSGVASWVGCLKPRLALATPPLVLMRNHHSPCI